MEASLVLDQQLLTVTEETGIDLAPGIPKPAGRRHLRGSPSDKKSGRSRNGSANNGAEQRKHTRHDGTHARDGTAPQRHALSPRILNQKVEVIQR
jgi:hypothetical protein